jgi:hypothetical protein
MSVRRALPAAVVLFAAATAVAACGDTSGDAESLPADTLIRPLAREPLTEADLAGITLTELSLELPWTTNKVTRDAAPGALPVAIAGVDVAGHESFDRATFLLEDSLSVPGYEIMISDSATVVACGDGDRNLAAPRSLIVTFGPAQAPATDESWTAVASATRMVRAGVVCDDGARVVWAAELAQGTEVRVLELRGPGRVVVDVR